MKVAAVYVACAIAAVLGKNIQVNDNGCPVDYKVEQLYPHKNCNKFYQCYHGDLVEHKCAADLYFSIEKQQCDYQHIVDCGNRIIPKPEENENDGGSNCDPSEAPQICDRKGSDGVLIAHMKCDAYYKCQSGKPIEVYCPPSQLYNQHKEECDWAENVDCGTRILPDENNDNTGNCNCIPGEAPSICAKDGSDGVLIAHENCNQFYKCAHGVPVAQKCPGTLLYNPYKEYCDWPSSVDCGDRVIPECDDDNSGGNDNGNTDIDNGGGDNGNNVGDGNGNCNCIPGEAPSICAKDGSDSVLIAHENCNQFYKCAHGVPVAQKCPGTLLYNPYKEYCDWPSSVDCGDRVIPECDDDNSGGNDNGNTDGDNGSGDNGNNVGGGNGNCNCIPGEAPSICAKDGSDGILIAHETCNQFYKCAHGVPVAQKCPGTLLYNPYKEYCDWPSSVDCGDRIILECDDDNSGGNDNGNTDIDNGGGDNGNNVGGGNGNCNCIPGEAPSICAKDGSDGILIAHETCNQFYKCAHGVPVAQKCPGTLLYNPYKEYCDWPSSVDCGDRIILECDDDNSGGNDNGNTDIDNGGGDNGNNVGGGNGNCNCIPGEAPSICTKDGSDGVLIAHENCNQFYKCAHGVPVAQKCPGTLLYNPYKEYCDWPSSVDCGDRVIPECDDDNSGGNDNGNTDGDNGGGDNGNNVGGGNGTCNCIPGEAPSICAKDGSDGVLIAHENCNQFYKCAHGVPVAQKCPRTLLYNPYKEYCDWPSSVDCGDRIIPECDDDNSGGNDNGNTEIDNGGGDNGNNVGGGNGNCNCVPGEAPSICAKDGSDSVLIAHENCNQFYKCAHGVPVAQKCPGTLLYNPYKEYCDWPSSVDCGDRVIPECDDDNSGGNDNGNTDGDNGGGDNGNNVGGGNGTCNCIPGEAPSICAKDGSDSVLIAHGNCNQFYKCAHGVPVAQKCPGTLLYNPYKEYCDWPSSVDCGDRVIPECDDDNSGGNDNGNTDGDNGGGDNGNNVGGGNGTCNCIPGEAPSICAKDGSDSVLIAHENCNQFYKCAHGVPVAQKCPGTLLYNPYKEYCDWPSSVDCGDRVIPECDDDNSGGNDNGNTDGDNGGGDNGNNVGGGKGTCNCIPGEAPSICAKDGSDSVLIAHENCNQFYKCAHGVPVAQKCPGTLLYNPYKEYCDWPSSVDCGDRIIPECDDDNSGGNDNGNTDIDNGGGDNGNNVGGGNGNCNCVPGEAPSICAKDGSDSVLIAHENCNQFYKCAHGVPVAQKCPGTLLYNPYKEYCDWPSSVDCGDRVIPECDDDNSGGNDNGNTDGDNGGGDNGNNVGGGNGTCNCIPGEAPSICAKDGSDSVLIAHGNCNQFYKCAHGVPVAQKCPGTLLYNPYKEYCDWPSSVDCGDRVIPECDDDNSGGNDNGNTDGDNGGGDNGNNVGGGNGTCNCIPGEAPSVCAKDGSDGVLIAHENCNQFYKCAHGVPVAQKCPGTLLYNPYKEYCDWPSSVDCGDRIIPECDDDNSGGNDNGNTDGDNGGGDNGNNVGGGNGTCNCIPGEAPSICAKDGSDGVLIAHENCNQFYKCAHGVPVAQKCPGTLLYNPYKEYCDWPSSVDCGDRIIPECDDDNSGGNDNGNTDGDNGGGDNGNNVGGGNGTCNCIPGEAPSICAKDGSDGVLIAHENCNQFYKCAHGVPVAQKCPGTLLYNPYKEYCDWPSSVDCGDRIIPECDDDNSGGNDNGNTDGDNGGGDNGNNVGGGNGTCNCIPGEAPSICAKDGSDGVLIAHENCNQFYKCAHGVPVAQKCPGTLLYNPYKEYCDWPSSVDCGDRVIPECDDDNSGGNDNGNTDGDNGGGDNGNNVGGGNGTCNCIPGEAPSICAKDGSDGVLIAHENCNQFYKCAHGVPVAQKCPGTLLYNPYKEYCDWPSSVDCGDRIIPECDDDNSGGNDNGNTDIDNGGGDNGNNVGGGNGNCNCIPGEAPSICAKDGSDSVLIAHENCNQFYECAHGVPVAQKCPGTLLYNPYKEYCDWPSSVDCGDRVIPECDDDNSGGNDNGNTDGDNGGGDNGNNVGGGNGNCNCIPGEAPSICAKDGSDGVLIAHENCNQFYKCAHGVPVAQKCPGTLLYNPYKEYCDWPSSVDCGDRVIPECDDDNSGGNDNGNTDGDNGSGDNGNNVGGGNGNCNCIPGEAPSICAKDGSDGILIAHETCNQFYKCAHGVPVAQKCPGTLLYNPYKEYCDWPSSVDCGDRVIPECDDDNSGGNDNGNTDGDNGGGDNGNNVGGGNGTCNCIPGEAPSICAKDGSDGVLIAHENCNQFYKCAHGVPVAQKCPGTLLYNPYKEYCDWPSSVDCGDRIIPECDDDNSGGNDNGNTDIDNGGGDNGNNVGGGNGNCNCIPGEAPSICAKDGSDSVLIAHENCNQFYKCAHGVPVAQKCPGTLLYNPYKEYCDWPSSVDCGNRVIPECDDDNSGGNDNGNTDGDNGGGDNGNNVGGGNGTCNCIPGEAPSICAKDGSDGVLIAHENCNQFYKCAHGVPVAQKCPGTLLYNPYKEYCDWPSSVACGDRVIPECDDDNNGGNVSRDFP